MEYLIRKENSIFEILQKFIDAKLDFVLVGGYAVSAFKHRFSIDADVVVQSNDLEKFESIVKKEGFKKTREKELENVYSSRFMRYEKDTASVDFLIDAIAARATGASFSYHILADNSIQKKIIGIEKEVFARVPIREMIIAMKLHSGRLTDFRDVAALMPCDSEKLKRHIQKGDAKKLTESIKKQSAFLKKPQFDDSFKGIFGPFSYNARDVQTAKELIKKMLGNK